MTRAHPDPVAGAVTAAVAGTVADVLGLQAARAAEGVPGADAASPAPVAAAGEDAVPAPARPLPPAAPAAAHTWPSLLSRLVAGDDIGGEAAEWALGEVMTGEAGDARLAGLLVGLRAKGETAAEVAGLARAMLARAEPLDVPGPLLDIVGTGGDGAGTVNISTAAALVAAAAGAVVVKHGNRAATSACGSADVLEALGVDLGLAPADVAAVGREAGITFAFAQRFHPAMRHAAGVRRALGVRTVFNVLGPLTNPARPAALAVGVADAHWAPVVAGAIAASGAAALVVRSDDGVDELTPTAPADVWVVAGGGTARARLDPVELGVARAGHDALRGTDAPGNAARIRALLDGEPGPLADAVALNAAAGLLALDVARGAPAGAADEVADDVAGSLTARLAPVLERTRGVMASGEGSSVLERWVAATRRRG